MSDLGDDILDKIERAMLETQESLLFRKKAALIQ